MTKTKTIIVIEVIELESEFYIKIGRKNINYRLKAKLDLNL